MSHSDSFPDLIAADLAELEASSLRRSRRVTSSPCAPRVLVDGRSMTAFASNDYLGLANAPELIAAAREAAQRWGVGAGASPLVSGHTAAHDKLERRLAEFTGFNAALSFSTGYLANLAVMPALLGRGDQIFADRLNHASLVDGALLSRATLSRYPHLDVAHLAGQLESSRAQRKLIVTDAVFSMDGDVAPLPQLLELAERHDAMLLVDDAHGFGVRGPQGRGSLAAAGLSSPRIILMGTLGKAAGVAGAFVAGSATLIEWLVQKARPYIFTTAAPPSQAETLVAAIDLIETADARRAHLSALIEMFAAGIERQNWLSLPSSTPIQPVLVGDNSACLHLSHALWEAGYWVPAIRPPTVPAGSARLRVSLSAAHTGDQVASLLGALDALHGARE